MSVRSLPALCLPAACAFVLALAAIAQPAWSQERTERVRFAAGQTSKTITGKIKGYDAVVYIVGAYAGQRLAVAMTTDNTSSYFNVTAPGAAQAMFFGATSGLSFDAVLPSSGDYRVQVYQMRYAARRGETANYSLKVEVTGGSDTTPQDPDFADGLSGGPDFWRVANVSQGDRLNIRARPSGQADIVARVGNGTVLRNRGCRMNGQTRWCKVEREDGSAAGWAAGRFLIE